MFRSRTSDRQRSAAANGMAIRAGSEHRPRPLQDKCSNHTMSAGPCHVLPPYQGKKHAEGMTAAPGFHLLELHSKQPEEFQSQAQLHPLAIFFVRVELNQGRQVGWTCRISGGKILSGAVEDTGRIGSGRKTRRWWKRSENSETTRCKTEAFPWRTTSAMAGTKKTVTHQQNQRKNPEPDLIPSRINPSFTSI
jgi:hypothetical protein